MTHTLDERNTASEPTTDCVVRSFWHGRFSPYEALCLASFVAAGVRVELFSDGPVSGLPAGVVLRNAREILDREVAFYQHEFDGPSPSLHANHFRYALLETLGGWWIDTDIMLVAEALPSTDTYISRQSDETLNVGVMRFPARHPLMQAARERTAARLDDARWGETGPQLVTNLQPIYARDMSIAPRESAYAIAADEFQKLFLPQAREEVIERTKNSTFVHLWNEMWRRAGIPKDIAPPRGSWLDMMFQRHQVPVVWSDRLDASYVERWAALRRDRDHAGHYNLVHHQELTRLRAEIESLRRGHHFGVSRIVGSLLARWRRRENKTRD